MFVKMLGKPREIDPELWRRMQASWSKQFGGPSSSSSSPTSPEPQSGAEADDISIDHPLGDRVIARLESSGSHVIRDDLIALFEPEANLRSSDFDRGTADAIDLQARNVTSNDAVDLDPERFRREMGGFIVSGFLIGRCLLDNHRTALTYSRPDQIEENAVRLFTWAITLDAGEAISRIPSVAMDFLEVYVPMQSEIGEVGLLDEQQATALVVKGLMEGVFLAFGEYELFG
jgi:hypothetical protein